MRAARRVLRVAVRGGGGGACREWRDCRAGGGTLFISVSFSVN